MDKDGSFVSSYNNTGWTYTYQPKQLDTPQITKFESPDQGVKITWNAINGAYGYRVFYKGSSGWKGMDNVTTNTYLDTDVRKTRTASSQAATTTTAGRISIPTPRHHIPNSPSPTSRTACVSAGTA